MVFNYLNFLTLAGGKQNANGVEYDIRSSKLYRFELSVCLSLFLNVDRCFHNTWIYTRSYYQ